MAVAEQAQQLVLHAVRLLVLVHEHVVEAGEHGVRGGGLLRAGDGHHGITPGRRLSALRSSIALWRMSGILAVRLDVPRGGGRPNSAILLRSVPVSFTIIRASSALTAASGVEWEAAGRRPSPRILRHFGANLPQANLASLGTAERLACGDIWSGWCQEWCRSDRRWGIC